MQVQHSPESSQFHNKPLLKRPKPTWRVVLGKTAWSRYTYERPQGDPLELIGSVSKGAQVGALAVTAEGQYVQVVGDYITALNTREITKAVANAPKESNALEHKFSKANSPRNVSKKEALAPIVIVKKRRVAIQP